MRGDTRGLSEGLAITISAAVSIVVAVVATWLAQSFWHVAHEQLFRIGPTVEGGGVGADWVASNTNAWLKALITLTHFADVLMGIFILLMVFIHWGAFRRLAGRMRTSGAVRPSETSAAAERPRSEDSTVADGGKQ